MENHEDSSYSMNTMKQSIRSTILYFVNSLSELPELFTGYPQAVVGVRYTAACRRPLERKKLSEVFNFELRRTKAALEESELIKGWGILKGEGHYLSRGS